MALQSNAALAEIRDTLLETYASNGPMNQLILSHLDPRVWRAPIVRSFRIRPQFQFERGAREIRHSNSRSRIDRRLFIQHALNTIEHGS